MHDLSSPAPAPEPAAARRLSARRGRLALGLACLLVLISLPVLVAILLVLRLWLGPLDVTDLARRLVAAHAGAELSVGRARLAWAGWQHGPTAPVDVMLDDLRLGASRARHAAVALDLRDALLGRLGIDAVSLDEARLRLLRTADGRWRPSADDGGPLDAATSGRPAGGRERRSGPPLDLSGLRLLEVRRSRLDLDGLRDAGAARPCSASIARLSLRAVAPPDPGAAAHVPAGVLDGVLSCGGLSLALSGASASRPSGPVWRLKGGPVVPRDLARLWPALAPLAGVAVPLGLDLVASDWQPAGWLPRPHRLVLQAAVGAGQMSLAPDEPAIAVRGGSLSLSLDGADLRHWQAAGRGRVLVGPEATPLALDGTLSQGRLPQGRLSQGELSRSVPPETGESMSGRLHMTLPTVEFASLSQLWPASLAQGARRWVTGNITQGRGRDLEATVGLASRAGWPGLALDRVAGRLEASELTLHWLRPITPLTHMDAVLTLDGLDALEIRSRHALETVPGRGALAVGPSRMRITGLSRKDQIGLIDTHLEGDLGDLLALLSHKRLNLLSRSPPGFSNPSGAVRAHLTLQLPLLDKVRADDIPIHLEADLAHAHLGQVAAGRDLDDAALSLTAGNDGLTVTGRGLIGGARATLRYDRDFRLGPPSQVVEKAQAQALIDDGVLQREGLDEGHRFSGSAALGVGYSQHRGGSATVDLHLDLAHARLATPIWSKRDGEAAEAAATLGLTGGRLVSIGGIEAHGNGLAVQAHADVAGGRASTLVIEHFAVGRSSGGGRIELPPASAPPAARRLRVQLHGPSFDLVPFLASGGGQTGGHAPLQAVGQRPGGGSATTATQTAWRVALAFDRVLISPTRSLSGLRATGEADGTRIERARLAIAGPAPVEATLSPEGEARRLVVQAPDTGRLLASLGVVQRITGGDLDLQGRLEDRPEGVRLAARARIGRFTVHDAPLAARLLRDLSIYGFLARGPERQIVVTRFEIPFTLEGDMLRLDDAHASNAAVGSTLRGGIDLGRQSLDLRGTIVPSYVINALPGRLPGIGHVFSPEKEGGLLAATLRITGPIARPEIKVNPLALLAPGILRRLLFD